ncbi:MAG TPA: type VI secretion system baseplate subunit TssG [Candidatus Deferrimicrobium sp.]|nr:type VI secretion system baseplate subunit TssG [Candidatus Deferrimicrobium sp.]
MPSDPLLMPDLCNRHNPFHYATALALLSKLGIDIHQIDLLASGEHENYHGEIAGQSPLPGTPLTAETRIRLHVGFPSAVDYLPYQMFYGLEGVGARTGAWEDDARSLMAPFDAAMIRYFSLALFHSLRFSFGLVDMTHLLRFLKLQDFSPWEGALSAEEAVFWVRIMPTYHFWAGNAHSVEFVLKFLFGCDVRIVENVEAEFAIPSGLQSRMGSSSSALGKSFVPGRVYRENDSCFEVQLCAVDSRKVIDLLPGKTLRRRLQWVIESCMPNSLDHRVTVKVVRQDRPGFRIGQTDDNAYLGYSTFA